MHTKTTITLPRTIRTHECTEADQLLQIHAGPDGKGGAPHQYQILIPRFFNDSPNLQSNYALDIRFQNGPICENGFNGITIESLLAIAADRLDRFQKGSFACMENERALTNIRSAMHHLHGRTRRRQREHTEGTNYERSHPTNDDMTGPDPSPAAENHSGEDQDERANQLAEGGTA